MDHYPVIMYWGGEVSCTESDVGYNGGLNTVMFMHRQNTNLEVFHSKICDVIGCDRNSFIVEYGSLSRYIL